MILPGDFWLLAESDTGGKSRFVVTQAATNNKQISSGVLRKYLADIHGSQ